MALDSCVAMETNPRDIKYEYRYEECNNNGKAANGRSCLTAFMNGSHSVSFSYLDLQQTLLARFI